MEQTALRPKPMPGQEPGPGRTSAGPGTTGGPGASGGSGRSGKDSRQRAVRGCGRRLLTVLAGLLCAVALVLTGVGLGTVGVTVISMSKLAEMQKLAETQKQTGAQTGAQTGVQGGAAPGEPAAPGRLADASAPGPYGKAASPSGAVRGTDRGAEGEGRVPGGPRAPRATLGVEAVDAPRRAGAQLIGVHRPGPGQAAGLVRGDVLLTFGGTRVRSAGDLAEAVATARPGRNVTLTVRHASGTRQSVTVKPGLVT